MKKLFYTAVAVLAFSGSGFAEGKVILPKTFRMNCHDFARGAMYCAVQSGFDFDTALAMKWAAYDQCAILNAR